MSHRAAVIAIVQARMGSVRLPGKVLMEVSGKPILGHVLVRLMAATTLDGIVVATSTLPQDTVVIDYARTLGVQTFAGSEGDVLGRFYEAALSCGAGTVVRISGEDLLIDPDIVDQVVELHQLESSDYTGNTVERTFVDGLYVEAISFSALEKAYREATLPFEREHVTPYILCNPSLFHIEGIKASGVFKKPEIKLCVDTQEDLDLIRILFQRLYREGELIDSRDAVTIMEEIILKSEATRGSAN